jgi:hypothetical protein
VAFPRRVVSFSSQSEMILQFFRSECAEGDGPPKNSDRIGPQKIPSVSLPSPSSGGRFQLGRVAP